MNHFHLGWRQEDWISLKIMGDSDNMPPEDILKEISTPEMDNFYNIRQYGLVDSGWDAASYNRSGIQEIYDELGFFPLTEEEKQK